MTKKKHSIKSIREFMSGTGFPFEWKMAKVLSEGRWNVKVADSFFDLEGSKEREIDIIAEKNINNITVVLIIECKFSKKDAWIFVQPYKRLHKYYYYVKHSPQTMPMKADELDKAIGHLRVLSSSEPSAINFKTFDKYRNKDSGSLAIKESLHKLAKALTYFYWEYSEPTIRHIFFPIILFSGPVYSARYEKTMKIKRENYVQFPFEFRAESYKSKGEDLHDITSPDMFPDKQFLDFEDKWGEIKMQGIKDSYSRLQNNYLIEVIAQNNFRQYINFLESDISKINISMWPVKQEAESKENQK